MPSRYWFRFNRTCIGVLKLNDFNNKKHPQPTTAFWKMLFILDFTRPKYGLNYHIICWRCFLASLYVFFVYMLVSVPHVSVTADFIASDLMFYWSRSTKCPCCRCSVFAHTFQHVQVPRSVQPVLMRSKYNSANPTHMLGNPLLKKNSRNSGEWLSSLHHCIFPRLHPSHRSICLSSPL